MRFLLITAALSLGCLSGRTQQVIDANSDAFTSVNHDPSILNSVNGMLFQPTKFIKVTAGTPFFMDRWMNAKLFDATGDSYASHSVRLNLLDNQVNFLDARGIEMVANTPIKRMLLTDTTTGTQYLFVLGDQIPEAEKALARTWLQVLVNDKVSLCKQTKKSIHESIAYGTSTTEEDIPSIDYYFVRMNANFIRVKTWVDLLQLFSDKKDAIDQYIHDHHLKGKSTEDYTQLVRYYNTFNTRI
jgi:hypothetical protein